jgi:PAP2 superfamily
MRAHARQIEARVLPRGRPDAVRQVLLFAGAYLLYELVRGLVNGHDVARASANATRVIDLERRLHVFIEPRVEAWAMHRPWLMHLADWVYLDAHGVLTCGALTWVYLRRNDSYAFLRNAFMIAMALALVGYVVYPTAPPRLMPQWGFADPIRQLTGIDAEHGPGSVLLNAYAAIPSMHVCFALLTGCSMARLTGRPALRALWRLYPPAIALVVVVTGNHYLTDIVLGTLAAGASLVLAGVLMVRARPDVWAFGEAVP